MSVIGPVQSHYHEGSPVGKRSLRWEGFVEKVGFEPAVTDDESGDDYITLHYIYLTTKGR